MISARRSVVPGGVSWQSQTNADSGRKPKVAPDPLMQDGLISHSTATFKINVPE
jgi:hypothetical protein